MTSFYICAHQDDWIFFRGEVAFQDLRNNSAILIFTTAGDADCLDGWWEVREQAALAAFRAAVPRAPLTLDVVMVPGSDSNLHPIVKYKSGTSGVYCLRLPNSRDPARDLTAFMNGLIPSFRAVDHSTCYSSWDDLCITIKNIVFTEARAAGVATPWVNSSLYKTSNQIDPGNHPDHIATGLVVKSFASNFCNRAWWWSYAIGGHDEWRLNPSDLKNKTILFDAYQRTINELNGLNGTPICSSPWADGLPKEWSAWGSFSHAEIVVYPNSDDRSPVGGSRRSRSA